MTPDEIRAYWKAWLDGASEAHLLMWHNAMVRGSVESALDDAVKQIESYRRLCLAGAAPAVAPPSA